MQIFRTDRRRLNLLSSPVSYGKVLKPPGHNVCSSTVAVLVGRMFFYEYSYSNTVAIFVRIQLLNRVALFEGSDIRYNVQ